MSNPPLLLKLKVWIKCCNPLYSYAMLDPDTIQAYIQGIIILKF
jgi:hypothetical protein